MRSKYVNKDFNQVVYHILYIYIYTCNENIFYVNVYIRLHMYTYMCPNACVPINNCLYIYIYIYRHIYIYLYNTPQAFKWIVEDCTTGPNFPQDAIHGVQDRAADVHVYFQWLVGQNSQGYSHFEMLLPRTSSCNDPNVILLPRSVPHCTSCGAIEDQKQVPPTTEAERIAKLFDPATYRGRLYQPPPLTGKLQPSKAKSDFVPVETSALENLFKTSTYEGKLHQIIPWSGKAPATQELTKEHFQKFFNIIPSAKKAEEDEVPTCEPAQATHTSPSSEEPCAPQPSAEPGAPCPAAPKAEAKPTEAPAD